MIELQSLLEQLKKYQWTELSHPLTNSSPYWDELPSNAVELTEPIINFDQMGICIQSFKFPGQFGTHIDFPGHFIQGGKLSNDFNIKDFVLPMVVIDISKKVANNPDYELTLSDIDKFEKEFNRIPPNSFVALRSDWSLRWPDKKKLENKDEIGNKHCPGWSLTALQFLCEERQVSAIGHETFDTDAPQTVIKTGQYACETYILKQQKFQLELLNNLRYLPATGGLIFITMPKIEGANGFPVRAWSIHP